MYQSIFIKIIGSGMIFLCCNLLSFYYIARIKTQINNLKNLSNALDILKSEIEFSFNTLDIAIKNICQNLTLGNQNFFIKDFFYAISQDLAKKNYTAQNIWLNRIDLLSKKIYMDPEDVFNLKSFSQVISNLDYKLQVSYLKKIMLALDKKVSKLEKNYCSQKKLYLNLGFLFGVLIIIIFI